MTNNEEYYLSLIDQLDPKIEEQKLEIDKWIAMKGEFI
jgi:hypothetical protein